MKVEQNIRKKVQALQRRKLQFDALIRFIKTHPRIASYAILRPLRNRTGLYFEGYALIRPVWENGKAILRLEKYSETIIIDDVHNNANFDMFDPGYRAIAKDVSRMSEARLEEILDKVHREMIPEDYEDEQSELG